MPVLGGLPRDDTVQVAARMSPHSSGEHLNLNSNATGGVAAAHSAAAKMAVAALQAGGGRSIGGGVSVSSAESRGGGGSGEFVSGIAAQLAHMVGQCRLTRWNPCWTRPELSC